MTAKGRGGARETNTRPKNSKTTRNIQAKRGRGGARVPALGALRAGAAGRGACSGQYIYIYIYI